MFIYKMSELEQARKMSQYELELKLDRMTQRAFSDEIQKPPRKPLSTVDVEVIKEYQKQFNAPVREYEMEVDEETGEERIATEADGSLKYKVVAKKFRVVPPPVLDVVEGLELLPTADELDEANIEVEKIGYALFERQTDLKNMLKQRKEAIKKIDELPIPETFVRRQLDSGKFIMYPNPNFDKQKFATELTKRLMIERIQEVDDNLDEVKAEITDLKDRYDEFNIKIANIPQVKMENDAKISVVKQANKERIKAYQENLNLMNRGAFQQDQMPNESEEDYVNRLQSNAEVDYVDDIKFEADMEVKRKFKEGLKQIVRDDAIVEQVANSIRINEIGIKKDIVKKFPLFKKKFVDLYGVNNKLVKATDITNFIDAFSKSLTGDDALLEYLIEGNPAQAEGARQLQEALQTELRQEETVEMAENNKSKVFIMTNPVNGRKLYWRLGQFIDEDSMTYQNTALYSMTGKRETYVEYIANQSNKIIKEQTGFTAKYLTEFFEKKNPSKMLALIIEPTSEYELNFPIAKIPNRNDDGFTIGWGIKADEIPQLVDFGKIKLALHKLFYENILSARHNNGNRIAGFANVKVSDDLVAIIMKLAKGDKILKQEVNGLKKTEQMIYDTLLSLASLHKTTPNNKDATITSMKERMVLIGGEIEAGNDNKALVKELYNIVKALKSFGVISNKEAIRYLSQF